VEQSDRHDRTWGAQRPQTVAKINIKLTSIRLNIGRAVLLGGNANNGTNAGLGNVNTNHVPGNVNRRVGSRQYFLKINTGVSPASWQKI
jgi:hypothetical protein